MIGDEEIPKDSREGETDKHDGGSQIDVRGLGKFEVEPEDIEEYLGEDQSIYYQPPFNKLLEDKDIFTEGVLDDIEVKSRIIRAVADEYRLYEREGAVNEKGIDLEKADEQTKARAKMMIEGYEARLNYIKKFVDKEAIEKHGITDITESLLLVFEGTKNNLKQYPYAVKYLSEMKGYFGTLGDRKTDKRREPVRVKTYAAFEEAELRLESQGMWAGLSEELPSEYETAANIVVSMPPVKKVNKTFKILRATEMIKKR